MAVVVRCSSALLRHHSSGLRRQPHLPFTRGEVAYFPPKMRKSAPSRQGKSDEQSEGNQLVISSHNIFMAVKDVMCSTEEVTRDKGDTQVDSVTNANVIVDHQVMALGKSPAAALVMGSALILSTPLKVLAETCEADGSLFNMPLFLFVALTGATVGGLLARQRKGELQRLNEQLRQINAALRRQAKIESYAPTLSCAPVGSKITENEVLVDPRKHNLISHLKSGKNFLRNQDPESAYVEFKSALELAQSIKDSTKEKKAARGLGASLQRQGKFKEAIKYHSMVLEMSEREGENSGNAEAYGAIADCFTELGELEQAGKYYDKYISQLQSD